MKTKYCAILALSLAVFSGFATANCPVEAQLAQQKAIVLDVNERIGVEAALAEAELMREAGATCAEIETRERVILVKGYFPVVSGPETGKLIQTIKLFKK